VKGEEEKELTDGSSGPANQGREKKLCGVLKLPQTETSNGGPECNSCQDRPQRIKINSLGAKTFG